MIDMLTIITALVIYDICKFCIKVVAKVIFERYKKIKHG